MVLDHLQIYYKDAMKKTVIGERVKKPESSKWWGSRILHRKGRETEQEAGT